MNSSKTKRSIERYFESHDPSYLTEDTMFIDMSSNEVTIGRQAVNNMLHQLYHVIFDAHLDISKTVVCDEYAFLEGKFIGRHIGNFKGLEATQKLVSVPICVAYDLDDGLIKVARTYLLSELLMEQLTN